MQKSYENIRDEYGPFDSYNADETACFYKMLQSKSLDLRGQKCHGGKLSEKRMTILLCSNMDGSVKSHGALTVTEGCRSNTLLIRKLG